MGLPAVGTLVTISLPCGFKRGIIKPSGPGVE